MSKETIKSENKGKMKEIKDSVKKQGMTIAWTYGDDFCDPYTTKKEAEKCRKENFGELYTKAEFAAFLPIYQAVFCGDEMHCTLDKYIEQMKNEAN